MSEVQERMKLWRQTYYAVLRAARVTGYTEQTYWAEQAAEAARRAVEAFDKQFKPSR